MLYLAKRFFLQEIEIAIEVYVLEFWGSYYTVYYSSTVKFYINEK